MNTTTHPHLGAVHACNLERVNLFFFFFLSGFFLFCLSLAKQAFHTIRTFIWMRHGGMGGVKGYRDCNF